MSLFKPFFLLTNTFLYLFTSAYMLFFPAAQVKCPWLAPSYKTDRWSLWYAPECCEREGFLWGSPCPTSTPSSLGSIQITHNSGGQLTVPSWPQRTRVLAHLSVHLTLAPALPSVSIHSDYRARDKKVLTYSTGAAKQREDQRWFGWMAVYWLTFTLFM